MPISFGLLASSQNILNRTTACFQYFYADATWTRPSNIIDNKVDVLIVAGGGAGGQGYFVSGLNAANYSGGGGGAGGVLYLTSVDVSSSPTVSVKIGEGGKLNFSEFGQIKRYMGSPSYFGPYTAPGGGFGADALDNLFTASDGISFIAASGGGGGGGTYVVDSLNGNYRILPGVGKQAYGGGSAIATAGYSGGGGGAGSAGNPSQSGSSGAGGAGVTGYFPGFLPSSLYFSAGGGGGYANALGAGSAYFGGGKGGPYADYIDYSNLYFWKYESTVTTSPLQTSGSLTLIFTGSASEWMQGEFFNIPSLVSVALASITYATTSTQKWQLINVNSSSYTFYSGILGGRNFNSSGSLLAQNSASTTPISGKGQNAQYNPVAGGYGAGGGGAGRPTESTQTSYPGKGAPGIVIVKWSAS